jgi:hypothetical protein
MAHYSFDLPEVVEAGPTRIRFTNDGGEPHHVQLFKLNDGVSMEEVSAGLEAGPEAVFELGHFDVAPAWWHLAGSHEPTPWWT